MTTTPGDRPLDYQDGGDDVEAAQVADQLDDDPDQVENFTDADSGSDSPR